MIAGIFLIIAAIDGLAFWGVILAAGAALSGIPLFGPILGGIFLVCGAIGVILAIVTLIGGVMAIQRKRWGIAVVGSILGLFLLGASLFVGLPIFEASLLSLISLILLLVSKNEF